MPILSAGQIQTIATTIFDAVGSPHDRSEWVATTLARANLAGHDSHGAMRIMQYTSLIQSGEIVPDAPTTVDRERSVTAMLDANWGWGQVAAREGIERAIAKARAHGTAVVAVRRSPHIGRLGEYVAIAAEADMIGLCYVNSNIKGPATVAPWGGIDGRFTPNPLAFAAPTGYAWSAVVDITSSVMPEGKVRDYHYRGAPLPEHTIIDANGNPSTDTKAFYGPPTGALLPLGGAMGHKGYGLAVMIESLAGGLSGSGYINEAAEADGNGVLFQVINIDAFEDVDAYKRRTRAMIDYVKSSRPGAGVEEVLFPGEPEYRMTERRMREGIPVPDTVWKEIQDLAGGLDVELEGV